MNSNLSILVYDTDKSSLQGLKKNIDLSAEKGDKILPVHSFEILEHSLNAANYDVLVLSFVSMEALQGNILRKASELCEIHEIIVIYKDQLQKRIEDFCRVIKVQCIPHEEFNIASFKIVLNLLRDKRELKHLNNSLQNKLSEYQHGIYEIISNMNEPVLVIDPQGKIEYSNKMAENLFRTGNKTLKGITIPLDITRSNSQINIRNDFININSQVTIAGINFSEKQSYLVTFEHENYKQSKHEEEAQHKYFQEILNSLPYPMYFKDQDGVFLKCNTKYCEFVGKDMDNIIGNTIYELMPSKFSTKCTLSDNKILATNSDMKFRVDFSGSHNTPMNIINHKAVFYLPETNQKGIVGVLIDGTEQVQLQNRLKHNEEKLRALFQFSNDAIIIHDFDLMIHDANQKASEIFDYDYYELTHNSIDELDKMKLYPKYLNEAVENGISRYETTFISRFGIEKQVEVSICVIDYEKQLVHSNIRILTPEKRDEEKDKFNDSLFDVLFATSDDAIFIENQDSLIVAANKAASDIFGYSQSELLQMKTTDLQPEHVKIQHKPLKEEHTSKTKTTRTIGITQKRNLLDIEIKSTEVCINKSIMFVSTIRDVSEKAELEGKIIENRNIETNWNMVKTIADNFSVPAQIIINNTGFIKDAFNDISENLKHIYSLLNKNIETVSKRDITKILESYNEYDVLELLNEIPYAIEETAEGVSRISSVINAVKEISLPDKGALTYYNVNKLLENALLLAKSEIECAARITTNLDDNIPFTIGFPNQINEVLLTIFRESLNHLAGLDSSEHTYMNITTAFAHTYFEVKVKHFGTNSSPDVINFMNQRFMSLYKDYSSDISKKRINEDYSNPFTSVSKIVTINHKGNFSVDLNDVNSTLYHITIPVKSSADDAMIEKQKEDLNV